MTTDKPSESVMVHLHSTPFEDDPEGAAAFYEAYGRALFLWGRLETHLQMNIIFIWNWPDSAAVRNTSDSSPPVSMKKRAEFWRKAFDTIPRLRPQKDVARALMTDVMDAAQDRAALLHSAPMGFISAEPLTAQFRSYRHKGEKLITTTTSVTLPQMQDMAHAFDKLNLRMLPITWLIATVDPGVVRPPEGQP